MRSARIFSSSVRKYAIEDSEKKETPSSSKRGRKIGKHAETKRLKVIKPLGCQILMVASGVLGNLEI